LTLYGCFPGAPFIVQDFGLADGLNSEMKNKQIEKLVSIFKQHKIKGRSRNCPPFSLFLKIKSSGNL
jgi:hypothetical protein